MRARLRYLQSLGFLDLPRVGSGKRITYTPEHIFWMALALQLELGGQPHKRVVEIHRFTQAEIHFWPFESGAVSQSLRALERKCKYGLEVGTSGLVELSAPKFAFWRSFVLISKICSRRSFGQKLKQYKGFGLAVDAVREQPVSGSIPCLSGKFTGIIWKSAPDIYTFVRIGPQFRWFGPILAISVSGKLVCGFREWFLRKQGNNQPCQRG